MSTRRVLPIFLVFLVATFALVFFGLGNYLAALQNADSVERLSALRAEIEQLRREQPLRTTGTAG
ncbi:MAG TPA: hypothetical protein VG106_09560, partial [Vicinamibacterales bacterium]|nr:hypothetical protein [Vicinamibacterales bacterium]